VKNLKEINKTAISVTRSAYDRQVIAAKSGLPNQARFAGFDASKGQAVLTTPDGGKLYFEISATNGLISRGAQVQIQPDGRSGIYDFSPGR